MSDANAPQGGETKTHKSDDWPRLFNILPYFEFGLIILLAGFLAAALVVGGLWIFFGRASEIYFRLGDVMREMNNNWRVGLLILIPLYFRPIFKFLFYLKEGPFGLKRRELKSLGPEPKSEYAGGTMTIIE